LKKITGARSGSVMLRELPHGPAPSMQAAS
jgi:hypothetical protein